jgi:hypothetical protein
MKSNQSLKLFIVLTTSLTFHTVQMAFGQDIKKSKYIVKEQLSVPFGTLVKMNIEIVDGEEAHDKGLQSSFLIRIKSVDSITLAKPLLIEFKDETGKFPTDEFELYKYLNSKDTVTLSSDTSDQIKKRYVGKKFKVVAYETGEFTGVPDGYFKYQEVRQDYGFCFRHYIIIVADLTKRTQ